MILDGKCCAYKVKFEKSQIGEKGGTHEVEECWKLVCVEKYYNGEAWEGRRDC